VTLLDKATVTKVHEASLQILSSVGVSVDSERGRRIFARAPGMELDGDHVRISRELVERALENAPVTADVYGQSVISASVSASVKRVSVSV
jgi:trimethylamine:corrinoid methyltransferase-like protein